MPQAPLSGAAVFETGVADVVAVFDAFGVGVACVDPDGVFTYVNPAGAALLGWRAERLLGEHVHEAIHHHRPDGTPLAREQCPLYAAIRARVVDRSLDDVFWAKDGSPVPVAHRLAPLHEDGEHVGAVLVFADVSERHRATDLLRARAAQQAAVAELGLAALGGGALQGLLEHASDLVARTLQIEFSAVLALDAGEDGLELRAGVGWRDGLVGNLTVGLDHGSLAGFAIAGDEPVVVQDLRSETRFRPPAWLLEHDVLSGVSVVIHGGDRPWGTKPWGALGAYSRLPSTFTADDLDFLHTVANTLAIAIERNDAEGELRRRNTEITELAEQLAKLADDRRRIMADALDAEDHAGERISQLLHDEVLQSLLTARQDLAKLGTMGAAGDEVLGRAKEAVVAAIRELRNAVVALHPVTLERRGLASAIEATARVHGVGGGFEVAVEVAEEAEGPHDQLLVSLAQELLNNVAQHAEARHVSVALRPLDGDLVFEVADDGRGMDPGRADEALDQGHIGLASIARRVESLGGRLEVVSGRGAGTCVRVVLPQQSAAAPG
jgi:PAS domain S-box-containing protein